MTFDRAYKCKVGPGSDIATYIDSAGRVRLHFTRRVEPKDVKDGVLLPVATTVATKKGGKMVTTLSISPVAAHALYDVLGRLLENMPPVEHRVDGEVLQTVE